MSEQNDGTDQGGNGNEANLARLREKADKTDKLERENLMLRAKVDTDHPVGAMFAESGYQGEMTLEAVTAAWEKVAPTIPTPPTPTEGEPPATGDPAQQTPTLPAGGPPPPALSEDEMRRGIGTSTYEPPKPPEVDNVKQAWTEYHNDVGRGMNREDAAGGVLGAIIGAAANGDERYLFNDGWTDEELAAGRTSRSG